MRFNDPEFSKRLSIFDNSVALIRELHVYGSLVKVNTSNDTDVSQHSGIGKRLLIEAERIARDAGYRSVAVISGVGVRNYYRKRGYHDGQFGYLFKTLVTEAEDVDLVQTATTHSSVESNDLSPAKREKFFILFRNIFVVSFSLLILLLYFK